MGEADFVCKFDMELKPPIIDLSREALPPFDTFSIKSDIHPYVVLDMLHDKIKEKGACRFYQDVFILEGDLQVATKEALNISAKVFRLSTTGDVCYISFSRTCSNFLACY